ncbi:helix-turn-helix domain-containing protein [Devosia naphthalenivorans]|uniref:helix-turn-helix domain-containing protein n=1 Tax=Devosia naphthalenivorans TaxID=2082392 RepID=UPI000D39CC9E|nr:helix-turn-helix transcriptional regulator [Devosia naphthalenivorans]
MLSKSKIAGADANPLRLDAGAWLKQLREEAGLSQRDLANILSLDYYTFISQLENGRGKIPSNRYREWAGALQIDEKIFVKKMLMYYDPHSYEILFGEEAA